MSLSLSHWYPGSGVVLDCIDPYLLWSSVFDCGVSRSYALALVYGLWKELFIPMAREINNLKKV